MCAKVTISIIIPVLHEENRIIELVRALSAHEEMEIIVVDGDSQASTITVLEDSFQGVVALRSEPGRAVQMNAGAKVATGDVLLFVHADTALPKDGLTAVRQVLENGFARCGAFELEFCPASLAGKIVGQWAGLRSRLDRRPYGDQAQFFTAQLFHELGGFAPLPIMEDVELMGRAVRAGAMPCIVPLKVKTSPRRYDREGWLVRGVRNWTMRVAFALGVPAHRLAGWYGSHTDESTEKKS